MILVGPSNLRYSRILLFYEHELVAAQVSATRSGLPNPGTIPYSARLVLMLATVAGWQVHLGVRLCSALASLVLLEKNGVHVPSFRHTTVYLAQQRSLRCRFACCSLSPGRLFKQLLQIMLALCLGNHLLRSEHFQCLVGFQFLVPNLVQ